MESNFVCALCLDFQSDDAAKDYFVTTECGHIFHNLCLKPAYENGHNRCPICRKKIQPENWRKLFGIQTVEKKKPKAFPNLQNSIGSCGEHPDYDYRFKIILVGDSAVGKSCLMQRFTDEAFNTNVFATIACDWRSKTINVGNKKINLSIWDTAGQERHRSLVTNYARDTHGALMVYDITEQDSFEDIEGWNTFVTDSGLPDIARVLVGNKTDLADDRKIPKDKGKALARKLDIPFFETSAKDSYNVEAAFRTLAAKILESDKLMKLVELKKENPGVQLKSEDQIMASPMHSACSQSFQFVKFGFNSTVNSVKAGWKSVTTSSSSSRSRTGSENN